MRYLRKNDGSIYVWTETLAKRGDMVECEAPVSAPVPEAPPPVAPAVPATPAPDIYAITDKAELREIGRNLTPPVVFPGHPTLTGMQAKLAEALGITAVES